MIERAIQLLRDGNHYSIEDERESNRIADWLEIKLEDNPYLFAAFQEPLPPGKAIVITCDGISLHDAFNDQVHSVSGTRLEQIKKLMEISNEIR